MQSWLVHMRLVPYIALILITGPVFFGQTVAAQSSPANGSWSLNADVGAIAGGTWLDGTDVPRVHTDVGALLAIGAMRRSSPSVAAGVVARLSAQPLSLREAGVNWDGGTLTDVQLLGVVAITLPRLNALSAQLELAGGASLLSGANQVFPFSRLARAVPAADAGIVLSRWHGERQSGASTTLANRLSLFARYGVIRVDASAGTDALADLGQSTAGYASRLTIGARMVR